MKKLPILFLFYISGLAAKSFAFWPFSSWQGSTNTNSHDQICQLLSDPKTINFPDAQDKLLQVIEKHANFVGTEDILMLPNEDLKLSQPCDPSLCNNSFCTKSGKMNPLDYAIITGNLEAVKAILRQSHDYLSKSPMNNVPIAILTILAAEQAYHKETENNKRNACMQNYLEILSALKASYSQKLQWCITPQEIQFNTTDLKNPEIAERFADLEGGNVLHFAIMTDPTGALLEQILPQSGSQCSTYIENQETSLHLAVRRKKFEILKGIINHAILEGTFEQCLSVRNANGQTPLDLAKNPDPHSWMVDLIQNELKRAKREREEAKKRAEQDLRRQKSRRAEL